MNNNISKYLLYGLLLSLPFERLLTFEFAAFTFKISYLFAALLVLFSLFNISKIKNRFCSYDWALLVFWLISFATVFWSLNKPLSLALNAVIFLAFATFFFARRFFGKIDQKNVINAIVWLGFFTSLFALWQFIGDSLGFGQSVTGLANLYLKDVFGFPRVQSTFFEPSFFANFLLVPLALSLHMSIVNKNRFDIKLIIISLVFFLTLSRGAFVSGAIGLVLLVIVISIWHRKYFTALLKSGFWLIISLLVAVLAIYWSAGQNGVSNYLRQARNQQDIVSAEGSDEFNPSRGYTIRVALRNSLKHPFGVGTGAFGALPEFESIRAVGNQRQTVNSIYPEILIETGFVGLAAFLCFVGLFLYELIRRSRRSLQTAFMLSAIFAMLVQFLSFSTYYLIYIWVFFAFAASWEKNEKTE